MTQPEKFCPLHGPYDASLPRCPYCEMESGGREHPPAPMPLNAEDASPSRSWAGQGTMPPPTAPDFEDILGDDIIAGGADDFLQEPAETGHTVILKREALKDDEPALLGIFWVKEGPTRGKIFPVRHGTIIGRNRGDVRLADPAVSDPHAKLTIEDQHFILWDFGSSNGTFINGEEIRSATPLKENDEIRFGNTVVVLKTLQ